MVFNRRAREAMQLAEDEARLLRHGYVGTEHLVLGLTRQRVKVLARIPTNDVREAVIQVVGFGKESQKGMLPYTPRAKTSLQFAEREAADAGDAEVDSRHLLLGLFREGEGVGMRVLLDLSQDLELLAQETRRAAGGFAAAEPDEPPEGLGLRERLRLRSRSRQRLGVRHEFEDAEDEEPQELTLEEAAAALRSLAGRDVHVMVVGSEGPPAAMAVGPLEVIDSPEGGRLEFSVRFAAGRMTFWVARETFEGASRTAEGIRMRLRDVSLWVQTP
jgi:ATP-dependent Clp protease ATP-binding subunit ClpA